MIDGYIAIAYDKSGAVIHVLCRRHGQSAGWTSYPRGTTLYIYFDFLRSRRLNRLSLEKGLEKR